MIASSSVQSVHAYVQQPKTYRIHLRRLYFSAKAQTEVLAEGHPLPTVNQPNSQTLIFPVKSGASHLLLLYIRLHISSYSVINIFRNTAAPKIFKIHKLIQIIFRAIIFTICSDQSLLCLNTLRKAYGPMNISAPFYSVNRQRLFINNFHHMPPSDFLMHIFYRTLIYFTSFLLNLFLIFLGIPQISFLLEKYTTKIAITKFSTFSQKLLR